MRRLLPVLPLARLPVRLLLWWVLARLLTVRSLLGRILLLCWPSAGLLSVRLLWLTVWSGLLLPVRIGWILPVRRLLPVVTHADKISAPDICAQRRLFDAEARSSAALLCVPCRPGTYLARDGI